MTCVERCHEPIRRAYKIVKREAPDLYKEAALQSEVKAVNDSVGPDGLVPTLLLYGTLPRLGFPTEKPAPSIYQRAVAVKKATDEISRIFAKRIQVKGWSQGTVRTRAIYTKLQSDPMYSLIVRKLKNWRDLSLFIRWTGKHVPCYFPMVH